MALCELRFWSSALQKQEAMNVILPDTGKGPFPVLYLLHGLSDDYTIWQRRTSIERYAAGLPIIVAMPDGGRSFFCNIPSGPSYEDHIVSDVVGAVERFFPARRSRKGRAIAGLSMGGYGAVMLALRHPDTFCAGVSHSGAFFFGGRDLRSEAHSDSDEVNGMWRQLPKGKYDCHKLASALRRKPARPALRFDCGLADFLLADNRDFHAHLRRIGYKHEYAEFAGDHNWDYWDLHIKDSLTFVSREFGLKS